MNCDYQERAELLRHELTKIRELTGRIETTGRRAQYKVPFQILVWGVPIVIGVALSGKFTDWWIWLTLIVIAVAMLSHFLLKDALIEKMKKMFSKIKLPTLRNLGSLIMPLIAIIISMGMVLATSIPDYLIRKAFDIQVTSAPIEVKTGSRYSIPFTVCFNKDDIAFDISIVLDSTAFESENSIFKFKAVNRQIQKDNILVKVPENLPPGQYMMKLMCSFKAKKKLFFEDESLGTFTVEKIIRLSVSN